MLVPPNEIHRARNGNWSAALRSRSEPPVPERVSYFVGPSFIRRFFNLKIDGQAFFINFERRRGRGVVRIVSSTRMRGFLHHGAQCTHWKMEFHSRQTR